MKHIILPLLFVTLSLLYPQFSCGEEEKATTKSTVQLMSEPGLTGQLMDRVRKGTPVEVLERKNGWSKITTSSGISGWVKDWVVTGIPEGKKIVVRRTHNAHEVYTDGKLDDFTGITWYRNKRVEGVSFPSSELYAYIGKKGDQKPFLRLVVRYFGDNWLFVDSFSIKIDDKVVGPIQSEFKRDNSGGSVWEWTDIFVNSEEYGLIQQIISADEVKVRFNGDKYYDDYRVNSKEKMNLQKILYAYESLGGQPIK